MEATQLLRKSTITKLALLWFDGCPHRPGALIDRSISSKSVDLIAFQFGMFPGRRQAHRSARIVHFIGNLAAHGSRVAEEGLHQVNHIFESMVIVIPILESYFRGKGSIDAEDCP